ncbi:MAG TPA: redoxin family protein [Pyrinomonadaceae bacterium]|jgi:thiol-disulfide isomerase/thioredoxin|nr:redoxin family protein [Pyrinomonadaceae bacterium]
MRRILLAVVSLGAALACVGGPGARNGDANAATDSARAAQGASKPSAAKPSSDAAGVPKVTEIKEDGLKTLLNAGAGRERPLLVNFWATWCVPCREEFPDLLKIKGQYPADRLDFVLVSLDDASEIGKAVPEFLTEVKATSLPTYLLNAADEGAAINLVDPQWGGELPATFLYDRAGKLVFKHKGAIRPEELRAAIEQSLGAKPSEAGSQK